MTNINFRAPAEQPGFGSTLFNLLAGALPVLAGVLTFAMFVTV